MVDENHFPGYHWDMTFDKPRTKAMKNFLARERDRVVGLSIETDGVFIYTNSHEWHDGGLSGTFRDDSETAAIKRFYERVTKASAEERAHLLGEQA